MSGAQEHVHVRAYELWELAGTPEGRDEEFWFAAESELSQPLHEKAPANGEAATFTRRASDFSR
ncbi:MAG: DUF2934 domain-containing protein [Bradyrhizobium sp.]|nr:MAG: DUF2934 domain-containing protein [Bradyrhizobium sp.]